MVDEQAIAQAARDLLAGCRVTEGQAFRIAAYPTKEKAGLEKAMARRFIKLRKRRLAAIQENFAASGKRGIIIVLQGMDTSGKDSLIRNVMSGLNPQGTAVTSFKAPTPDELAHDFLWRVHAAVPRRGQIGVFNRSHYEDVLAARVHADRLAEAGLPGDPAHDAFWESRLADIRNFEDYMTRQGYVFIKVFLHISFDEQRRRILRRLDRPEKRWKFDEHDLSERQLWPRYQVAYEKAIRATATGVAPWHVLPSDHKWLARLVTMEALVEALERLDPEPPPASPALLKQIETFRTALKNDSLASAS